MLGVGVWVLRKGGEGDGDGGWGCCLEMSHMLHMQRVHSLAHSLTLPHASRS